VFKELQMKGIDLIGLAKERIVGAPRLSAAPKNEEKIFHPQFKEPLILGRHSPLIHFLDQIRDEAHRFAMTHHRRLRSKGTNKSALAEVPGVGPVRQRALLKHFGSLGRILDASVEELARVPKMDLRSAQTVYQRFHGGDQRTPL